MLCPNCGEDNNRVIDTRQMGGCEGIRRVRLCLLCGHPWGTIERPDRPLFQEDSDRIITKK
jgi:transcriptional regulator NrdR family protein